MRCGRRMRPSSATAEVPRYRSPRAGVNWRDARQYVRWLSGVTGRGFRLPRASEWDYLAKDVVEQEVKKLWDDPRLAWPPTMPTTLARTESHPGRWAFSAKTGRGIFDLDGNVWEWTDTCWLNEGRESSGETTETAAVRESWPGRTRPTSPSSSVRCRWGMLDRLSPCEHLGSGWCSMMKMKEEFGAHCERCARPCGSPYLTFSGSPSGPCPSHPAPGSSRRLCATPLARPPAVHPRRAVRRSPQRCRSPPSSPSSERATPAESSSAAAEAPRRCGLSPVPGEWLTGRGDVADDGGDQPAHVEPDQAIHVDRGVRRPFADLISKTTRTSATS